MKKLFDGTDRLAFRGGSYSLIVTILVLAILIVVNIFASALPATVTKYDMSATQLYSVTSNTKVVLNNLQQDVTIYWVVQADEEDDILENLLAKYESLSSHVSVVKKNPDVYPTFAAQYTDEDVPNNSLVVESGERSRYIAYDDIYLTDMDIYSYSYNTSFDGEGAITSAIDYVVTEDLPKLYTLEGHGEAELPATFADQIEKENIEVESLSLLTTDAVPEDADCLMIYAPESDLSEAEADLLADYVSGGGKLLIMAGPARDSALTNLQSLLTRHGVEPVEGIAVDTDPGGYLAYEGPSVLIPTLASSAVTDALREENYYVMMPISQGLDVSGAGSSVTALLTTGDATFSKAAGYELTTYEKEEGDIDGPFALAVSVEDGEGRMIWFSSSYFLEDMFNAYSSGANGDLAMNALSALVGEREAMAIRSKSLNYNYLTISESTASLLRIVMIGVFPVAFLAVGIAVVLRRRRLQNEAV